MKVYQDIDSILKSITRTMDCLYREEHTGAYEGKMCIGKEFNVKIGDGWFMINDRKFNLEDYADEKDLKADFIDEFINMVNQVISK